MEKKEKPIEIVIMNDMEGKAIKLGRNAMKCEVDISLLSDKEKDYLINKLNSNGVLSSNSDLLDDNGNLTVESIKAAYEKQQAKLQKNYKLAEAEVTEYENGGRKPSIWSSHWLNLTNDLKNSLIKRIKKEKTRRAIDKEYLHLIEKYEQGGKRPEWVGNWKGSEELLERIKLEDERRENEEIKAIESGQFDQLADIVDKYGSDLLKEKLSAGLMPRREILGMLWDEIFAPVQGYVILKADELFHKCDECPRRIVWNCYIRKEKILTDARLSKLRDIKNWLGDSWAYECFCEYCDDIREAIVYVKVSRQVGVYTLSAKISLD